MGSRGKREEEAGRQRRKTGGEKETRLDRAMRLDDLNDFTILTLA
jgi:hypothetical protein